MSTTPATSPISPLPGQDDQSARLAASAEVGQVEDTISLEAFQRWLENKAHEALHWFENLSPEGLTASEIYMLRDDFERVVFEARNATALLMQFKLEQGA